MNTYNLYNAEAQFKNLLLAEKVSAITVRNYLSDFRHFYGWYISSNVDNNLIENLTLELLNNYKKYMVNSELPHKTVNRRLSTVRKYCSLLRNSSVIFSTPEAGLTNLTLESNVKNSVRPQNLSIVAAFKSHLSLYMNKSNVDKEIKTIYQLIEEIS